MSSGDITNRIVIIGLLLVALGGEVIMYLLFRQGKREVGEITLVITSITSGLVGYLSRELKHSILPDPLKTEVVNKADDPVPVEEKKEAK